MIENFLRCFRDHNQTNWYELLTAAEFSYNPAHIAHLNISPFQLDLGWKSKSSFCLLSNSDSSVESVNALQKRLFAAESDARFAQALPRAQKAAYNNQRYLPPNYKVGDQV